MVLGEETVLATEVPTREELVRRASELAPVLRKNAAWSEENRRIHDESIEAMADAGIFRLRTPARYGGYEVDTRTLVDIGTELARGDGSAAWVASVYWIPTWMTCLFPDAVQDEVFSVQDARVCGTLSPSATATQVDGGIVVNGKWGYQTGALHAQWQEIVAVLMGPDGPVMPVIALVPLSDLQVVDDWYTAGLKGTGSVSTIASELFVPQERVLPLPAILEGQSASALNADSAIYRGPLLPVASASSVGTVLGLARAAWDAFFERLPNRKITYTGYEKQAEAPLTHLQVAEAAIKIDETEFHARRLADMVDAKGVGNEAWTLDERIRARADVGAICRLAKEAVDVLANASGATSNFIDQPMQRVARDVHAVNLHALMHPDTNAELYGRILCGLQPDTLYV